MNFINPSSSPHNFGKIIAFDTESLRYGRGKNEYQKFYNLDFYDGNEHIYVDDIEQFYVELKGLIDEYKKITLIAHNIDYDLQILGLMNNVKEKRLFNLKFEYGIISGVIYLKFGNKNKRVEFIDTMNYFNTSLSELGKQIGQNKIDESEYKLSPVKWNKQLEKTGKQRVQKDTEILYKYFMKFLKNKDFVYGLTIASTAFKTYQDKFLNRVISIPEEYLTPALLSYRGGRTEPYLINKEAVYAYSLDINSLYPYVMRNNKYSYKFHKEINKINFDNIENADYNYLFNLDYSYSEDFERLPVMIKRNDKKLVQSYTAKNVWLTGNELLDMYKQDSNLLIAFRKGLEFHNDYLFTDFVDYFYNKRLKSSGYNKSFYKLILNSVYGKFGQHKSQTKIRWNDELDIEDTIFLNGKQRIKQNGKTYSIHDGFLTTKEDFELKRLYNPLIASEITANARLVNFEWQKRIGFNNIFYTDTDSFFSKRNWTMSDKLGGLKIDKIIIEGKEYEKKGLFYFYGNKDYEVILDNGLRYRVLKGIPKKSIDLQNGNYEINQFSSLLTNRKNGIVEVEKKIKKITRKNDKMRYEKKDIGLVGFPFFSIDQ